MAGKMCPQCGNQTLFLSPTGRSCSKCGFTMVQQQHRDRDSSLPHQRKLCVNCYRHTVNEDGICENCGAYHFTR